MSKLNKGKISRELQQEQKVAVKANRLLEEKITEEFILDYNNMSEFDGVRAYSLIKLQELVNINRDTKDDNLILEKVKKLMNISSEKGFRNYLKEIRKSLNLINIGEAEKQLRIKEAELKSKRYFLNNTEKVLINTQLLSLLYEPVMAKLRGDGIDYAGNCVRINLAIKLLRDGIEDRKINIINMFVGYEDVIESYTIDYSENNDKYILPSTSGGQSIIKDSILVKWNAIDKLHNSYIANNVSYKLFTEESKRRLATAMEDEENYNKRKVGLDLISYDGIFMNYAVVLEIELKRLILLEVNIEKNITLIDIINYLREGKIEELDDEKIKIIDWIRRRRNDAVHGRAVSFKDFQLLKKELIDKRLLFIIEKSLEKRIDKTESTISTNLLSL